MPGRSGRVGLLDPGEGAIGVLLGSPDAREGSVGVLAEPGRQREEVVVEIPLIQEIDVLGEADV